ncbi:MAG: hypothetical protein QOJ58_4621 [Alphaproteobacteria bacterium]|jgi:hypothetical protein|nr:hypothetical protein [Alphaproteobacteria bacterium]
MNTHPRKQQEALTNCLFLVPGQLTVTTQVKHPPPSELGSPGSFVSTADISTQRNHPSPRPGRRTTALTCPHRHEGGTAAL